MVPYKDSEEKANFLTELKAKIVELKLPIEKPDEFEFFSKIGELIDTVKSIEEPKDIEKVVKLVEDSDIPIQLIGFSFPPERTATGLTATNKNDKGQHKKKLTTLHETVRRVKYIPTRPKSKVKTYSNTQFQVQYDFVRTLIAFAIPHMCTMCNFYVSMSHFGLL